MTEAERKAELVKKLELIDKLEAADHSAWPAPGPAPQADVKATGTQEDPVPADLYGSILSRAADSFSDEAGLAQRFKSKGYQAIGRNKNGDVIVQDDTGTWYRDTNHALEGNIFNSIASHLGDTLPLAGGILGGVAGEGVGSVPLAALGAGEGAAVKDMIGRSLGVRKGSALESIGDVAGEGAQTAASEALGLGVAKIPGVKQINKALVEGGKKLVAGASSFLSGVDREAVMRLINRPKEVMSSLTPQAKQALATKAAAELTERRATEGKAIDAARAQFQQVYGNRPGNTQPLIDQLERGLQEAAPNAEGHSPMSPSQRRRLRQLQVDLTEPWVGETVDPTARSAKLLFGPPETLPQPPAKNPWQMYGVESPSVPAPQAPVQYSPLVGVENRYPEKTLGSLQKTADMVDAELAAYFDKNKATRRTSRYLNQLSLLRGGIKKNAQTVSPELRAADVRFNRAKRDWKLLAPLAREGGEEAFVANGVTSGTRTARREAAQRQIPNSYENISDMMAESAFIAPPPRPGVSPAARQWGGLATGLATGGTAVAAGANPWVLIPAAAVGAMTSPRVNRSVVGYGSRALTPFAWRPDLFFQGAGHAGMEEIAPRIQGRISPWRLKLDVPPPTDEENSP